jgi:CubicO group peptidase (beta-lactamase class C family)
MKTDRLLLGFCAGAMLVSCLNASRQAENALRGQVTVGKPIPEAALLPIMARNHVPAVSIAVIRGGGIDWAGGYGVREAGGSDRVDDKTLFQAASISKPVTAAGALRMVETGELSLEEDVNLKLRSWKVPENEFTEKRPVTLRNLLSHSAGLTVHGFPGYPEGVELPTLVQILNGEKPANTEPIRVDIEPGTKSRYSGGGYLVAQQLMMDVAARPFPELMRKLVLEPAGMTSSTFEQPLLQNRRAQAAAGHRSDGKPIAGQWHVYPEMAAAGLWTTPTDLARFAIEIRRAYKGLSDALLSQAMARAMLTRQMDDYGLGFALPSGGVFRFQHGGGNEGYTCFLVLSVETGDGVAVMTNGDSGEVLFKAVIAAIGAAYGWDV